MNKPQYLIVYLLLFLLVGTVTEPAHAVRSARLKYDVQESGKAEAISFEITISRLGVRYDYREKDQRNSLIYRADTTPTMVTVDHQDRRGFKITDSGIDYYVELMKAKRQDIEERLNELPKPRRKDIKQRMNLSPIDPSQKLEPPQFKSTGDTLWNGLMAKTGRLTTADGSEGTVIMSTDPLVSLNHQQEKTLTNFSDFLYRWVNISSQASDSDMSHPRNLIAEQYTTLIRYRGPNSTLSLNDWDQIDRSEKFFQAPTRYQIEELQELGKKEKQSR